MTHELYNIKAGLDDLSKRLLGSGDLNNLCNLVIALSDELEAMQRWQENETYARRSADDE